jgi:hypothetical protein
MEAFTKLWAALWVEGGDVVAERLFAMIFSARYRVPWSPRVINVVVDQNRVFFDKRRLGGRWSTLGAVGAMARDDVLPRVADLSCGGDAERWEAERTRPDILKRSRGGVTAVRIARICTENKRRVLVR